jgi:hypothetical protein
MQNWFPSLTLRFHVRDSNWNPYIDKLYSANAALSVQVAVEDRLTDRLSHLFSLSSVRSVPSCHSIFKLRPNRPNLFSMRGLRLKKATA